MISLSMMQHASGAVDAIDAAANAVCDAVRNETAARATRDEFLDAITNSLLGQPNPMTEKPHSATSAEKAGKSSDEYKRMDALVQDAECARILAWALLERVKLTAKLAVVAVAGAA
jgi:hypothetical protein